MNNSLKELINLQERFQPYLLNDDYTFIGPANQDLLEPFMKTANNLAPIVEFERKFEHFLGNKEAAITALSVLPPNTQLRIYVIHNRSESMLLHDTIEGYCKENKINFIP